MSRSAPAIDERSAFTLLETLLALAVAAIVIAAIAAAHLSLRRALGITFGHPASRSETLAALDRLASELRCATYVEEPNRSLPPALTAGVSADGVWRLEFLARLPPPNEPDLRYTRLYKLRYEARLVPGGMALYRAAVRYDLYNKTQSPDGSSTDKPLARLREWRATFFDGQRWSDQWPATDNGPRLPHRVRFEIVDAGGAPAAVETWIARDMEFAPPARSAPSGAASRSGY